jgi:hypothetical protein
LRAFLYNQQSHIREKIMADKLLELRERYGREHLPRLFSETVGNTPTDVRENYLGFGIAVGGGAGLAIGAGVGVAIFGNVGLGIGFGLCLGTGLGVAIGASLGNTRANAQESPHEDGSCA